MTRATSAISLRSPFALMFPEAVEEILDRAEHMNLPRTRYSPLSRRAQWHSAAAERASEADDEVLDDELDVHIQSSCGRAEPDGDEDDFGF